MTRAHSLDWRDRLLITWWRVTNSLHHCPDCGRRGYDPETPRWDEDPIVLQFGWLSQRCGGCGKVLLDAPPPSLWDQ